MRFTSRALDRCRIARINGPDQLEKAGERLWRKSSCVAGNNEHADDVIDDRVNIQPATTLGFSSWNAGELSKIPAKGYLVGDRDWGASGMRRIGSITVTYLISPRVPSITSGEAEWIGRSMDVDRGKIWFIRDVVISCTAYKTMRNAEEE